MGGLRTSKNTIVAIVVRHYRAAHDVGVERVPQPQLEIFRRNLIRLRHTSNLTQEKLSEKAEITTRYLQSVESGAFGVSFAVLIRLRRGLNCSWEDLLKGLK